MAASGVLRRASSPSAMDFTIKSVPSPEVTVPFCLVPSPEFSQAPWYSLPCRLSCRSSDETRQTW
ncbi:hypothetical protein, partial [Vibrio vulnificus]|uniref:hypothetical protein n=1 Tax=Vibrio vulnificus TaxID=672 RepID=UPI001CA54061